MLRKITRLLKAKGKQLYNSTKKLLHPAIESSSVQKINLVDRKAIVKSSKIRGDVEIGPYAEVTNSWVTGNVLIEPHSKIIDTRLCGNIKIGYHTTVNGPNTDAYSLINSIEIGRYTSVARNVSIQEYFHRSDRISSYFVNQNIFDDQMKQDIMSNGDIIIGNDVWIGTQVVILSGVSIGDGAIIGANSVVTRDIPPYAVAVGGPAKVLKYRFEVSLVERLKELKWWNWSREKILALSELFRKPLTHEVLDEMSKVIPKD